MAPSITAIAVVVLPTELLSKKGNIHSIKRFVKTHEGLPQHEKIYKGKKQNPYLQKYLQTGLIGLEPTTT